MKTYSAKVCLCDGREIVVGSPTGRLWQFSRFVVNFVADLFVPCQSPRFWSAVNAMDDFLFTKQNTYAEKFLDARANNILEVYQKANLPNDESVTE